MKKKFMKKNSWKKFMKKNIQEKKIMKKNFMLSLKILKSKFSFFCRDHVRNTLWKFEEDPIKTEGAVRSRLFRVRLHFWAPPPGKKLGSTLAQGPFGGPRYTGQ